MALQNKLKAFVRFDGSGRVIPSSLILQKSKPKVGNWKQINATQCCDAAPTTTTTTTADPRPRISLSACGALLPYQEITIVNGSSICDPMIYITGDFSQLQQAPFYIIVGSSSRVFGAMGNNQAYPSAPCTSCGGGTTTTTTTASAFMFNVNLASSSQSACAGMPAWNLYAATPFLGNGTTLYYTSQLNWAYDGAYGSYLNYQNVVYTLSGATISNNGTSCSSITTTTTTTIPSYSATATRVFPYVDPCITPNNCTVATNDGLPLSASTLSITITSGGTFTSLLDGLAFNNVFWLQSEGVKYQYTIQGDGSFATIAYTGEPCS